MTPLKSTISNNTRQLILEALENLGQDGLTRDQIITLQKLTPDKHTRKQFGVSLGWMQQDGLIEDHNGVFFLSKSPQQKHVSQPSQNGASNIGSPVATENAQKITLAPFKAGRKPSAVTIYLSAATYQDAVMFVLYFRIGNQIPLPMGATWKVHVGEETPKWSPYQEDYRGVRMIRVVLADGRNFDTPIAEGHTVTVLQEEA